MNKKDNKEEKKIFRPGKKPVNGSGKFVYERLRSVQLSGFQIATGSDIFKKKLLTRREAD
jgi:hypothetical protein